MALQYFQKELHCKTVNILTLAQVLQHYTIHIGTVKWWTNEPLMVAKKPKQRRAKPSKDNEEDRVSCEFLNRPLHGGDSSTCPPKILIRSGSIYIVNLHCWGNAYYYQSFILITNDNVFGIISLSYRITLKSTFRWNHIFNTANSMVL